MLKRQQVSIDRSNPLSVSIEGGCKQVEYGAQKMGLYITPKHTFTCVRDAREKVKFKKGEKNICTHTPFFFKCILMMIIKKSEKTVCWLKGKIYIYINIKESLTRNVLKKRRKKERETVDLNTRAAGCCCGVGSVKVR